MSSFKLTNIFKGDKGIWIIVFFLFIFSILSVYSAVGNLAYVNAAGNTTQYLLRQGILLLFGVFAIICTHLIPYRFFSGLSVYAFYLSIALLLVTIFWGLDINQAKRWITLPMGVTFQTSDFAKIALMMFLARNLSIKEKQIQNFNGVVKFLFMPILVTCGLIVLADFSTAILIFITSFVLLIIGRVKFRYILSGIGIAVFSAFLFFLIVKSFGLSHRADTWTNRIENFRAGEENIQSRHAKIAVATGGLFGKGPGNSEQRIVLPHSYSDYIFAIIVEEFGLIFGAIPLILLYLFLFYRSRNIVKKIPRKFGAYVTVGLALIIVLQAFAHMAVAVDLIPVTGQPLPFVSYGGTSILFTGIAIGVILSVSREVYAEESEAGDENDTKINGTNNENI